MQMTRLNTSRRGGRPHSWTLTSALLLVLMACASNPCSALPTVKLGFLLPFPAGDAAIPALLASEWISATQVALKVLRDKYQDKFLVDALVANSNCNKGDAAAGAQKLVDQGVVGVVGPACSEAALGAASVLTPQGIPFISFAATADIFRDSTKFFNFFRTVFGDRHQAAAIQSVIKLFNFKNIHLYYTNETYGQALGYDIWQFAKETGAKVHWLTVPYPPPTTNDYNWLFDNSTGRLVSGTDTLVVFACLPNVAEALWTTAVQKGMNAFPWWFLASDGGVAFDLIGQQSGDVSPAILAAALQGELGISPYKGDYDPATSTFKPFIDFWRQQEYEDFPGLLTMRVEPRFNHTRLYVPYLIDAVWTFFEAFNNIITIQSKEVTANLVQSCLSGMPADCINFHGATGPMAFNTTTGERLESINTPQYSLVNLVGVEWEAKADWREADMNAFSIDLRYMLSRPGPVPAGGYGEAAVPYQMPAEYTQPYYIDPSFSQFPAPPPPPQPGMSPAAIAVTVILVVIAAALIIFVVVKLVQRRRKRVDTEGQEFIVSNGFARMI